MLQLQCLAVVFVSAALGLSAPAQEWLCIDGPVQSRRGAAFDTHRGRLVAFGSDGGTWECDGTQWFPRPTAVAPPRRVGPAMVYDPVRRHTLLFGGVAAGVTQTRMSDTWAWDGSSWRQLVGVVAPPGGSGVPIAFDEVRGRVVLFGGATTFEHDGTQWTPHTPSLSPTLGGAMTFDPVRGVCLMFVMPALWQWDGTNWMWLSSVAAPGSSSANHNVAFDRARQRLVVFGVQAAPATTLEWDGTNWFQLPAVPNLTRAQHAMYFDAGRQQVVLHGGVDGIYTRSDQWAWDGSTWSLIAPESRPFERSDVVFTHDPARGTVLLFGGSSFNTGYAYYDSWEWDGHRWHFLAPAAHPVPTAYAATGVDPLNGRLTLFGGWTYGIGSIGDMWNWDGTNWTAMSPAARPSARHWHAMATDTVRNRIVLFGGRDSTQTFADTWEWDGVNWTQVATPQAPPARLRHAMAFDAVRGRSIVFGGNPTYPTAAWTDDSWTWDGTAWQQVALNAAPSVLQKPDALFDPGAGKVLLVGINNATIPVFETWEFDGAAWTRLPVQGPRPGTSPKLAHDARRGRMVLFDGSMVLELTAAPAAVAPYGSGCGTPAPVLAARTRPRIGEPAFGLEMAVQPGQPVVFALAAGSGVTPLGNGCTLLLQQPMASAFAVADAFGMAVQLVALPVVPALRGQTLCGQAGVLVPASPAGFDLSQGLRLQVGD